MRNALLILATVCIVAGVVWYAIPLGLIAAGIAIGAIAWFSE